MSAKTWWTNNYNRHQFTLSADWSLSLFRATLPPPCKLRYIFSGWHVSKHPICFTTRWTFYMFFQQGWLSQIKGSPQSKHRQKPGCKGGNQRTEVKREGKSKILENKSGLLDFCLSPELIRRPHSALCQINLPVKTFLFAPPPPSPNWNCQKCTGFSHLSGL